MGFMHYICPKCKSIDTISEQEWSEDGSERPLGGLFRTIYEGCDIKCEECGFQQRYVLSKRRKFAAMDWKKWSKKRRRDMIFGILTAVSIIFGVIAIAIGLIWCKSVILVVSLVNFILSWVFSAMISD
jgi:Zn ribbon nucleic-acid-binding protein